MTIAQRFKSALILSIVAVLAVVGLTPSPANAADGVGYVGDCRIDSPNPTAGAGSEIIFVGGSVTCASSHVVAVQVRIEQYASDGWRNYYDSAPRNPTSGYTRLPSTGGKITSHTGYGVYCRPSTFYRSVTTSNIDGVQRVHASTSPFASCGGTA